MTAHEEQDERIVLLILGGKSSRQIAVAMLPALAGRFTAQMIGHAAAGHLNQPGARIVGNSFLRPLRCGRKQGFLYGIFSGAEVAEQATHGAKYLRRQVA